jgi:twitching motility protein PilT
MLTDKDKLQEFAQEREVDFAYALESYGRFRVNAFHQRGSISIVCRSIPFNIRTIDELNLPPVIRELATRSAGSSSSPARPARASRRRSRR